MLTIKRLGDTYSVNSSNKRDTFLLPTDLLRVVKSFWTVIKYSA